MRRIKAKPGGQLRAYDAGESRRFKDRNRRAAAGRKMTANRSQEV